MLKFAWHSLKREDALTAYANTLLRVHEKHPESNQEELSFLLEAIQTQDLHTEDDFQHAILQTDLLAANGHNEEAYAGYLKLLDDPRAKMPASYHHLHFQIGKTAEKIGMIDIALASLQEAMLVNPDDLETRHIWLRPIWKRISMMRLSIPLAPLCRLRRAMSIISFGSALS